MKRNKLLRGLNVFFSIMGILAVGSVLFVFITNLTGLGTFMSVLGLVKTQSLYNVDTSQIIEGATSGVVSALKDPYSKYLDQDTWKALKERLEAEFGGIGVYVLQDAEGRLKVVSPIKDTPAYTAGIKDGDIIIRINGESTMGMNSDDAVSLMRGEPGTQLILGVYRESDNQEHDFKIIREIINVPSVEDTIVDDAGQIGYIRLNQFHAHSAQEIADSLNRLLGENHIKSLILDLRNNGGGDFDAAISIASIFLDGDEVVSVSDSRGNGDVYRASADKVDIPVIVLVNQNSASSSEILAGALQDNDRAVLVGQITYGKGLVQTVYPLRNGGALKLTTQKYFTPNGTDINEIGIKPDYIVENDWEKNQDLQLKKAIELLKEEIY